MLSDRKGKNVITRLFSSCKTACIQEKTLSHLRKEKLRVVFVLYSCEDMKRECFFLPWLNRLDHILQRSFHRATAEKGLARWEIKGTPARVKGGHVPLISLK